jgi:hypothetical protein
MIRFVDGFDLCSFGQCSPVKYNGYQVSFSQGRMLNGRDNVGQAIAIENSAFGEVFYETILDSQPVWGFHMDFQWEQSPFVAMQWYRIGGLAGTAFARTGKWISSGRWARSSRRPARPSRSERFRRSN